MRVDWGMMLTIFLALVLARIIEPIFFSGRLRVSTETHSPAEAKVVYANPIDGYIAQHYPNAR